MYNLQNIFLISSFLSQFQRLLTAQCGGRVVHVKLGRCFDLLPRGIASQIVHAFAADAHPPCVPLSSCSSPIHLSHASGDATMDSATSSVDLAMAPRFAQLDLSLSLVGLAMNTRWSSVPRTGTLIRKWGSSLRVGMPWTLAQKVQWPCSTVRWIHETMASVGDHDAGGRTTCTQLSPAPVLLQPWIWPLPASRLKGNTIPL